MQKREFNLEERLLKFSTAIIRLVETMSRSLASVHIGNQLMRSGTSPLLNHGEAQAAESQQDFVHKMKICLKELRETRRSLLLVKEVPLTKNTESVVTLIHETEELIKIFYTSIRTAKSHIIREEPMIYETSASELER